MRKTGWTTKRVPSRRISEKNKINFHERIRSLLVSVLVDNVWLKALRKGYELTTSSRFGSRCIRTTASRYAGSRRSTRTHPT